MYRAVSSRFCTRLLRRVLNDLNDFRRWNRPILIPLIPHLESHEILLASIPHGGRLITVHGAGWMQVSVKGPGESYKSGRSCERRRRSNPRPQLACREGPGAEHLLACTPPASTASSGSNHTADGGPAQPTPAGDAGSALLFDLPVELSNQQSQTTRGIPRPRALHCDWRPKTTASQAVSTGLNERACVVTPARTLLSS